MFKKILNTVSSRLVAAIVNILLLVFNSKTLGVEGVGAIGLILAVCMLIVVVNDIFCGGGLAYLVPKYEMSSLLFFPVFFSLFNTFLVSVLFYYLKLFPYSQALYVFFLSFIFTLSSIGKIFLIGKEKINNLNQVELLNP